MTAMRRATGTTSHGNRRRSIWSRWVRRVEDEAHHLHELEVEGESPATPAISILEVLLVVAPVFMAIVGLALLAYYLIA